MKITRAVSEYNEILNSLPESKRGSLAFQLRILKDLHLKYEAQFSGISGWKTKLYCETILKKQKINNDLKDAIAALYNVQTIDNFKIFIRSNENHPLKKVISAFLKKGFINFSEIITTDEIIGFLRDVFEIYQLGHGRKGDIMSNSDHLKWAICSPLIESLPDEKLEREAEILLKPNPDSEWESKNVYNAGAIRINGTTYLIYRGENNNKISRLGLLIIDEQGNKIRIKQPIFDTLEAGEDHISHEDPRWQILDYQGEKRIYLSYCECTDGKSREVLLWCDLDKFVKLARSSLNTFSKDEWIELWKKSGDKYSFPEISDRGSVLFPEKINGKYIVMYRIHKISNYLDGLYYTYMDEIQNPLSRKKERLVMAPESPIKWGDARDGKIGTGAPPIKTEFGWLILYHAHRIDEICNLRKYSIGFILTDLNNPEKILYRSENPILQPIEEYEREGFVSNVVFTCGAVKKNRDELIVYYAGADRVLCEAKAKLSELIPQNLRN